MNLQFGVWNLDGRPVEPEFLERVTATLGGYTLLSHQSFANGAGRICLFAKNGDGTQNVSPPIFRSYDCLITWNGRLDNRETLVEQLARTHALDGSDIGVVAAAYERWNLRCLGKLLGDWTICIWDPVDHSLSLAKDFLGTLPLFYRRNPDQLLWSNALDPLVLLDRRALTLDEEYLAGWFTSFPDATRTPYARIRAVPPSTVVRWNGRQLSERRFWDFDSRKEIRYGSDSDYEEHFRSLLEVAIQRRLKSESPVLAELSGGVDSSSIVCVADALVLRGVGATPRVDTLSFYDDSEPNWDERPYFAVVERLRGRVGHHIDLSSPSNLKFAFKKTSFAATPASGAQPSEAAQSLMEVFNQQNYRVLLSGIGGDEVLGGVPTPIPELGNLIATADLTKLVRQLTAWALAARKTVFQLFGETLIHFLPASLRKQNPYAQLCWLKSDFAHRRRSALYGYEKRWRFLGPLPSTQENLHALDGLRRQLACVPTNEASYEKRYPYLDRDLLEFLYAIPREQLVRPGQRRSLMRRALSGIVPAEILDRKRKAFVYRSPLLALNSNWLSLLALTQDMEAARLEIVDPHKFLLMLTEGREGKEIPIVAAMRTVAIELWLRSLRHHGLLRDFARSSVQSQPTVTAARNTPSINPSVHRISAG